MKLFPAVRYKLFYATLALHPAAAASSGRHAGAALLRQHRKRLSASIGAKDCQLSAISFQQLAFSNQLSAINIVLLIMDAVFNSILSTPVAIMAIVRNNNNSTTLSINANH